MDKLNYIQIGDRVEYETDGARYFGIVGSIEQTAEKVYLRLQVPEGRREPTRLPLEAVLAVHRVVDGRHTTSTYFHEETGTAPLTERGDQQQQALRLRDYERGEVAIYVQTERVPKVVAVLPLPFSVSAFPFEDQPGDPPTSVLRYIGPWKKEQTLIARRLVHGRVIRRFAVSGL
jgi:hypothetical protein